MACSVILARFLSQGIVSRRILSSPSYRKYALQLHPATVGRNKFGTNVIVSRTEGVGAESTLPSAREPTATKPSQDNSSGTTLDELGIDDDDEIEQEDMFVDAHPSFQFQGREWGGPRRGGRLPEPTRYGDWERKGRCSDF